MDSEKEWIEPSAASALYGPIQLLSHSEVLTRNNLDKKMKNATHIVWATGVSMVPAEVIKQYYL